MGIAEDLRAVAVTLTKDLGNPCTLTKITKGVYDPLLGKSSEIAQEFQTYSAPVKKMSIQFGDNGMNTNLSAFDSNKVIVPWIGQEIDKSWLYNGYNIVSVQPTETQGLIVIYTIEIGEK